MKTLPLAAAAFVLASAVCAPAAETHRTDRILLTCPLDRSPRMADIDLAMSSFHIEASQSTRRQMLERVRSVCATGLRFASLLPFYNLPVAPNGTLLSQTKP